MENSISNYSNLLFSYNFIESRIDGKFQYENSDIAIHIIGNIFNADDIYFHDYAHKKDIFNELSELWREQGEKLFSKLNGSYIIFLYDKKNGSVYISNDIAGSIPLFYTRNKNKITFSVFPLEGKIEYSYIPTMMFLRFIPSPATIHKNIYKFSPATCFRLYKNRIEINNYRSELLKITYRDNRFVEMEVENLLRKAVKRNFMLPQEKALYVSGGVDSALIAAIANDGNEKFSLVSGIVDNNRKIQRNLDIISDTLKKNIDIVYIDKEYLFEKHNQLLQIYKRPLFKPDAILYYALFEKLKERNIKYAITGHGADELFGGYPRYIWEKISFFLTPLKYILKSPSFLRIPMVHRLRINLDAIATTNMNKRIYAWTAGMSEDHLRQIFPKGRVNNVLLPKTGIYNDKLADMMYIDIEGLLPDMILETAFISSIFHNVFLSLPFLDRELFEFALSLPSGQKVNNMVTKFFIRRMAKKYYPKQISMQDQIGVRIPISKWIKEEPFKGAIISSMDDAEIELKGIINSGVYKQLINDHINGWHDYGREIFMIYNLYKYKKEFANER